MCYKEEREKIEDLLLEQLGKLMTSSRYWTMFRVGKQATRLVLIYNTIFTHVKVKHLRKVGFNIGFRQLPDNSGATKQASSA